MFSYRTGLVMALAVLAILPLPLASADDCVTPIVRLRAEGLLVLADADGEAMLVGLGVPDPGTGVFTALVIRPSACTSAGLGNLVGAQAASLGTMAPEQTLLPLP